MFAHARKREERVTEASVCSHYIYIHIQHAGARNLNVSRTILSPLDPKRKICDLHYYSARFYATINF
jgi:hypothetical protein